MSEPLDIEKELEDGRKPGNQTFFKDENKNLLIVTRGHPFERDNFFSMIDALLDVIGAISNIQQHKVFLKKII